MMRCPDCGAEVEGRHLRHDAGCLTGLDADVQMAADREWFEAHPWAEAYWRPVHVSEIVEAWIAGGRIAPGLHNHG